jgi:hypothetical protein
MIQRLTPDRFDCEFRTVFDTMFLPTRRVWEPLGLPFRHLDWQVVASWAPYDFDSPQLEALRAGARCMGDSEVVITDCEAEPGHRHPALFNLEEDSIYEAYMDGPLGTDAALFGRSATWGVYFEYESSLGYVGGNPAFMEVFLREVGGVDVLKRELRDMLAESRAETEIWEISEVLRRVGWDGGVVRRGDSPSKP